MGKLICTDAFGIDLGLSFSSIAYHDPCENQVKILEFMKSGIKKDFILSILPMVEDTEVTLGREETQPRRIMSRSFSLSDRPRDLEILNALLKMIKSIIKTTTKAKKPKLETFKSYEVEENEES